MAEVISAQGKTPQGGKRKGPSRRGLGSWIALAVLLHAEALLIVGLVLYVFAPRDADLRQRIQAGAQESIEIGMMDEDAAREIIADLEREQEKAREEQVKKEVESKKAPGQVVDIPAPRDERRPDEARFASEYDSTVEKETKRYGKFDEKARLGGTTGEAARSQPPAAASPSPGPLAMRTPSQGAARRPPGPAAAEQPADREGSMSGAPLMPDPSGPADTTPLGSSSRRAPGGGGALPGGGPALTPSEQQMARAIGGGTQDALKDIDDGDETALNSKKWRFASFFNRVKRQVADHWHPEEAYRRRDPTGSVYGQKNRLTILRVQLKADGSLANVALEQPCGVEFLDDEAIEAFRQAQPFPNPPHQLIEEGGLITFRFGFLFELSTTPRMRLFKYNGL